MADLKPLRDRLTALCKRAALKGTILLSSEGINLFVAGNPQSIDLLLTELRALPGLHDLEPKISPSDHQPFTRMLVRIKKEIIAFGVAGIDPGKRTSPKLPPKELKKWLDEGRPITLLDTRNDYEIKLGTFQNALPIGIKTFREFPAAVRGLAEDLKDNPIVMFCTGGIRCEKAGPYMESQGFKNVFQLDGGILKYFEEVGEHHYTGDCFVFDQRVGVDPSLNETPNGQCFACQTPLTAEELKDDRFVDGKSCPYCFKSTARQMAESINRRHQKLKELSHPLPGSVPYVNFRPIKVPGKFAGQTLLQFVTQIFPHVPVSYWEAEFKAGRFFDSKHNPVTENTVAKSGQRYLHASPLKSEPDVNADLTILYEDQAVLVIDKPAPLPVHPSGRYNRNTLQYFLDELYAPNRPRPAHRLDANTAGVMVVARSKHFAGILQPQFTRGEVEKVYRARVQGQPIEESFVCNLAISEDTLEVGSRGATEGGRAAETQFKVLQRNSDGTTLLEVRPLTGRTNQIRVHLWQLGFPICGEQLYLPDKKLGKVQTHQLGDAPLELTAVRIGFHHPLSKQWMEFNSRSAK